MVKRQLEIMTVGGGCFWSIEAIFKEVKGVKMVLSGFSGGTVPGKPTYKEVCSGLTGHAEVVEVTFDANVISYENLLNIFMTNHDPTTLNIKNNGFGSQYRSVIYYHNDTQKQIAEMRVKEIDAYFKRPITTEISPAVKFHVAEDYHQDYYDNNQEAAYCKSIIVPKLAKFRSMHYDKLKGMNVQIN